MEKAIYISSLFQLRFWNDEYTRIYFGNEFCDKLIPNLEDTSEIISFVKEKKLSLSLLTTYATDDNLIKFEMLFNILEKAKIDTEIIINDWGLFKIAKNYPFTLVLGRLLSKQKRGPRILNVIDNLPRVAQDRFRKCSINAYFNEFLDKIGIKRIELDNLLQGVSLEEIEDKNLHFSIYIPFGYVTVSRVCLYSYNKILNRTNCKNICNKECLMHHCILNHAEMPASLILKGNAVFFNNSNIETILQNKENRIDRIVYEPEIPF